MANQIFLVERREYRPADEDAYGGISYDQFPRVVAGYSTVGEANRRAKAEVRRVCRRSRHCLPEDERYSQSRYYCRVENRDGSTNTVDYIDFEVKVLECHDRYEHETTSDEEDDSDFDPDAYDEDEHEGLDVGNEPTAANGSSGPAAASASAPNPPVPVPSQAQGASAAPAPQNNTPAPEVSPAVPSAPVPAPAQVANHPPGPALQSAAPAVRQRPLDLPYGTPNCLSGCNFAFSGTQTPYPESRLCELINEYDGSCRSYRDLLESPDIVDFLIRDGDVPPAIDELANAHEITLLTQRQLFQIIDLMPPSGILRTMFARERLHIVALMDGRTRNATATLLASIEDRADSQEHELRLVTSSVTVPVQPRDLVLPPIQEILRRPTRNFEQRPLVPSDPERPFSGYSYARIGTQYPLTDPQLTLLISQLGGINRRFEPATNHIDFIIAGSDIQPETFGLIAEHNLEVLTQREFVSSLPPSRTLDHMLASVGGLDSAAWRQGERHTDIDAVIIAAEENAVARMEITEALSTGISDLARDFGRGGNAMEQGEASTSTMSQQSTGAATDSMDSSHAGPSTGEVASQTSTSAPPPAAFSGQAPNGKVSNSNQGITAPSRPQSSATSNDTSTPLIWTETSTPSQPLHNTTESSSSTSEFSSRALQPLSSNSGNSVPQRRAFVEDDDEEDENGNGNERSPKRRRGEGEGDVDVGESSNGVNMLS
jgi:hypothetical protein